MAASPELASRDHIQRVVPLAQRALPRPVDAGRSRRTAYTQDRLAGALLVGAAVANALDSRSVKPVIGVHHLEGHLSPLLAELKPAFRLLRCSCPAGTAVVRRRASVVIGFETRRTTLRAKPSTNREASDSLIRAGPRSPSWRRRGAMAP
jgi:N6-L-threonylcarbamoyladenine synthase